MEKYNSLNEKQKSIYAAEKLLFVNLNLAPHHNSEKQFIYSLVDPTNNEVRYVGQTGNPKRRYAGHLYNKRGLNKRLLWIASLKKQKLKPEMKILEEVTKTEKTLEREKRWIFHLTQQGSVLFQRESFLNPYLMKEIMLTKNIDFLNVGLTGKFWQKLFSADNLDELLSREVMDKVIAETGELDTVKIFEQVRGECEKRNGEPSIIFL